MATHLVQSAEQPPRARALRMTSRTLFWLSAIWMAIAGIMTILGITGSHLDWRGFDNPAQHRADIWPYLLVGMTGQLASFILSEHEKKLAELERQMQQLRDRTNLDPT